MVFHLDLNFILFCLSLFFSFSLFYLSFLLHSLVLSLLIRSLLISMSFNLFLRLLRFVLPLRHVLSLCVDFLSVSHHFFHPHFPSLLCPVLLSSPLLSTCPPIHRQRLISVWHFVIFPSYLITHIHTREKNLSGILILDVWQPDIVPISPPTGGGCLVDRWRGCRLRLSFWLMLKFETGRSWHQCGLDIKY